MASETTRAGSVSSILSSYQERKIERPPSPVEDSLRKTDWVLDEKKVFKLPNNYYGVPPREVTFFRNDREIKFKVQMEEPLSMWYPIVMLAGDTTNDTTKELGIHIWSQTGSENGYKSLYERLDELNKAGKFSDELLDEYRAICKSAIDDFFGYLVGREPKTGPKEIGNQHKDWVFKYSNLNEKYFSKLTGSLRVSLINKAVQNNYTEAADAIELGIKAIDTRQHPAEVYSLATMGSGIKIKL